MDRVPRLFADFRADIFAQAKNVADSFHAHQAAVVWFAVECCMDGNPAFSKCCFYIKGDFDIRTVDVGDFLNFRVKSLFAQDRTSFRSV